MTDPGGEGGSLSHKLLVCCSSPHTDVGANCLSPHSLSLGGGEGGGGGDRHTAGGPLIDSNDRDTTKTVNTFDGSHFISTTTKVAFGQILGGGGGGLEPLGWPWLALVVMATVGC